VHLDTGNVGFSIRTEYGRQAIMLCTFQDPKFLRHANDGSVVDQNIFGSMHVNISLVISKMTVVNEDILAIDDEDCRSSVMIGIHAVKQNTRGISSIFGSHLKMESLLRKEETMARLATSSFIYLVWTHR
jgi:hypothetical protein